MKPRQSFPDNVRFRHPWRPYQARVLAELDAHLSDRHFHLVAAPGSGKTVVGLEALRRVGSPALVFAPSIAIRDQWIRRFLESFWSETGPPDWLSTDASRPRILTVATYQSLGRYEKKEEIGALVTTLEAAGVRTLVFDEAHHLRNQWWRTLHRIKAGLKSPFVIALTATPPYDVTQIEWNRYATLCGDVDEEISAPELVKAKNLCPHQDFVYFCEPTAVERQALEGYDRRVSVALAELALDDAFIEAVQHHPVLANPAGNVDVMLADGDYYLSLAVFLNHARGVVPEALIRVLGLEGVTLPPFNASWAEVLLSGALFADRASFRQHEAALDLVQRRFTACGAIERRSVALRGSARNIRRLRASISKLRSVADIVELESRTLDWKLRMLVLTDHIREEEFPGHDGVEKAFSRTGVVPIFEYLRKLRLPGVTLGVMTGRLVIIPASAREAALQIAAGSGIAPADLAMRPLWHDAGHLRLEHASGDSGACLDLVTRLFSEGHITVLVGTAALLGEGWDAPAVNALVMATAIGSHVSTNQIRGRAIRVDPRDEFKTANIWHLACVRSRQDLEEVRLMTDTGERRADDWTLLDRRFRSFVGLRHAEPIIENGIERLGILAPASSADIASVNARMCRAAVARDRMAEAWRNAIFHPSATRSRVVHEVFVPVPRIPTHRVTRHWLRGAGGWFDWLRARWLLRRVSRVSRALLDSLAEAGLVTSIFADVQVTIGREHVNVRLAGVTCREESLFVSALRELFDPLQSPRYLLVTKDEAFAVPGVLAQRKAHAQAFAQRWRRSVGRVTLLYAHSEAGKQCLLAARQRYLAAMRHPRTDSRLRWS